MIANMRRYILFALVLIACVSCATTGGGVGQNSVEEANLRIARQYIDYYNNDIEKFAGIYTEDCVVNGGVHTNREELLESEKRFLAYAPNRKMRLVAMHASGNVVTVQGAIVDADRGADWQVPFCAVLTMRDGMIATDWTYAEFDKLARSE